MNKTPVEYDAQSDTLDIHLSDAQIAESDEIAPGLIVDYDAAGNIVAIELLDASKVVNRTVEHAVITK